MGNLIELNDLTKVSVNIQFKLDTLDVVLIVTTGGIGYLARSFYDHFDTRVRRNVELQQKNYNTLMDQAEAKGVKAIFVRVHPDVAVYEPSGGSLSILERTQDYVQYRIAFSS